MRIAMALTEQSEISLLADAVRHGHQIVGRYSTADELARQLESVTPAVAIAQATERHLTEELLHRCDERGVRLVIVASTEIERRHARALGRYETIDGASDWAEIEQHLSVVPRATEVVTPSNPEPGKVIAVWGPAGAPGRTTVAIAIAAELAAAGHRVALVDADTYSGSIAPTLGLLDEAPGFAAACRLAGADSLSRQELERVGQRYVSPAGSFWVLTGIGRPTRWPELSAARVEGVIAECRAWVGFTVIDTGFSLENDEEISSDLFAPRRNAATLATLRNADRVVAVGAADPVGLSRFLRAHVDLIELIASGRVLVAINKIRSSAVGMNAQGQVSQTLSRFGGIDAAAMIPFDPAGLDAAILSGTTLGDAAPKSPALAEIRRFVTARLLPPTDLPRRGRRPRQRRFRLGGRRTSGFPPIK